MDAGDDDEFSLRATMGTSVIDNTLFASETFEAAQRDTQALFPTAIGAEHDDAINTGDTIHPDTNGVQARTCIEAGTKEPQLIAPAAVESVSPHPAPLRTASLLMETSCLVVSGVCGDVAQDAPAHVLPSMASVLEFLMVDSGFTVLHARTVHMNTDTALKYLGLGQRDQGRRDLEGVLHGIDASTHQEFIPFIKKVLFVC